MDNKITKFKQRRAARIMSRLDSANRMDKGTEDYQWITVKGSHVPIDEAGNVQGGANGALKGKNFSKAKKYAAGDFSHIEKKGSTAGKSQPTKDMSKEASEMLKTYENAKKYKDARVEALMRRSLTRQFGSIEKAQEMANSRSEKIGKEVGSEVLEKNKKNWIQSKPESGSTIDKTKKEMQGVRHEQMIRSAQKTGDKAAIKSHVDRIDTEKKAGSGFRVGESVYVKNADGSYETRKGSKGEWTHVSAKDAKSMIANELANGAKFSYDRYDWTKSKLPDTQMAQNLIKNSLGGNSGTTNCADSADPRAEMSSFRNNVKDGKLTPERETLHQQIVANAFMVKDKDGNVVGEVKKPKGKPVYTFLGGGPAAGKSTITNMLKKKGLFPQDDEAVTLNPDDYKEQLPEAKEWAENPPDDENYSGWANNTHEESSAISKRINAVACSNGYNVVNDACNNSGAKKVIKKIEEARAAGMEVAGVYVTCPTEEALKRNAARSSSEGSKGRLPLPDVVNDTHIDISRIFEEIAPHFDHIELYDTMRKDKDGNPLLVASCKKGQKVEVHDNTAYKEFLAKGNEETTKERETRKK